MWLARPKPTQRQPNEGAVEWARKETMAFTIWKCRVYGLLLLVNLVLAAFISKGMPGHFLWRWLGIPLLLTFVLNFAAFGFFVSAAIGELLDRPRK
jgi:hypothetical protein